MSKKSSEFTQITEITDNVQLSLLDLTRAVGDRNIRIPIKEGIRKTVQGNWFPTIYLNLPPYNLVNGSTADVITVLRQAENDAYNMGGATIVLSSMYRVSSNWDVRDIVNVQGLGETTCGLQPTDNFKGPAIMRSIPITGRTDGQILQRFAHFRIDGRATGRIIVEGSVTSGSNQLTNAVSSSTIATGNLIEGFGIPENTTVVSHVGSIITMSAQATLTAPDMRACTRRAVTKTASGSANSKTLTMANTVGIEVGMRISGTNLEVDEDELSQWSRITAVSSSSVTISRPVKTTGTFSLLVWDEIDGFHAVEADTAPNYDPNRSYAGVLMEHVQMRKLPGTGFLARTKRHQIHLVGCKTDGNFGYGIHITACNDSYLDRTNSGSNFKSAVVLSSLATPRMSGEFYLTEMMDKHNEVVFNGVREAQMYGSDINGSLRARKNPQEPSAIMCIYGVNWKWFTNNQPGDASVISAYIHAIDIHVDIIGGGLKWSQATRPRFLVNTTGQGSVTFIGQSFRTDIADPDCPFSEALSTPNVARVKLLITDPLTGELSMGASSWTPQVVPALTQTGYSVAYASSRGNVTRLPNGLAWITGDLEFTPTYTTATGEVRITGLGSVLTPSSTVPTQRIQLQLRSSSAAWGTNILEIAGNVSSSGNITISRTGSAQNEAEMFFTSFPSGTAQKISFQGMVQTAAAFSNGSGSLSLNPIPFVTNRAPGATTKQLSVAGTYTGTTPSALEYRVLSSGAPISGFDWQVLGTFAATSGVWSGKTNAIPQGGMYTVEFRILGLPNVNVASSPFGIGLVVSLYGQSNASRQPTSVPSSTIVPSARAFFRANTGVVGQGNNAVQSFANQLTTIFNVPVCVLCEGLGNSPAASLVPGTAPWTALEAAIAQTGGDSEIMYYTQGENDPTTDKTAYKASVLAMRDRLLTVTTRNASQLTWAWAQTGTNNTTANTGSSAANWEALRDAQWEWCDTNGGLKAAHTIDLPHVDDFHYTSDGYVTLNDRMARSISKKYALAPNDGLGPNPKYAIHASGTNSVTVSFNLNGAASMIGTGQLTGWEVSADNFATNLSTTSVVRSGNDVVITLAASAGTPLKVRHLYGVNPNITNLIRGTNIAGLAGDVAVIPFDLETLETVPVAPDPVAPTLTDIEAYRTGSTSWVNVPYGAVTWSENVTGQGLTPFAQVFDIDVPSGTPPVGGWPILCFCHASGGDKNIGLGYLNNYFKQPALANGYAVAALEFRHPVSNYDQDVPHWDIALALQGLRSLHSALNLDRTWIGAVATSRGNLITWTTLQADLANPEAETYAGRQSSNGVKAVWSVSGQATYRPTQWASLFCTPGAAYDQYLTTYPDDVRLGSAMNSVLAAPEGRVPDMVMIHELPYYSPQQQSFVLADDKHYPNNGKVMRETYQTAGYADRIVTIDNQDGEVAQGHVEQFIDCVPWFHTVRTQGVRGLEAWAIVRTRRRNGGLYYLPTPLSGVSNQTDGLGTVAQGGNIGGIFDSSYGVIDRTLGVAGATGAPAGQTSVSLKPTLSTFTNGKNAALFDSTDRLVAAHPNNAQTQDCYTWTDIQEWTAAVNRNSTSVFIGQPDLTGQKMALSVMNRTAGAILPNDLKGYRQFANWLAGTNY